jgi:hypothetical protein
MNTATPTEQDLREQLTAAEQELHDAERVLGAAQLDHQDPRAASDRVAEAHATIARLEAALSELSERDKRARDAEDERREAIERWREMAWYAEFVKRIRPVIELRDQLKEAEGHVMALSHVAGARSTSAHTYQAPQAIAALRLPYSPVADAGEQRFRWESGRANDALLTVKQLEGAARQLDPLVKEAASEAKALGANVTPEQLPWAE